MKYRCEKTSIAGFVQQLAVACGGIAMSDWRWMTASECADWWKSAMEKKSTQIQTWAENDKYGADTKAGFCLVWVSAS